MPRLRRLLAVLALVASAAVGTATIPSADAAPATGHVTVAHVDAFLIQGGHRVEVRVLARNHSGRPAPYRRMVVLLKPASGTRAHYLGPFSVPHLDAGRQRVVRRSLSLRTIPPGRYRAYVCPKSHVNPWCAHTSAASLVVPPSALRSSTTRLDLGDTALTDQPAARGFVIHNAGRLGTGRLRTSVAGPFYVDLSGCPQTTLGAGRSCRVTVRSTASSAGTATGRVAVRAPHGGAVTVIVVATRHEPYSLSPTSLDLGPVGVGSSAHALATFTDATDEAVSPTVAVQGDGFSLDGAGTCPTGTPVAAHASCTVGVAFTATSTGPASGTLTVTVGDQTVSTALAANGD